MKPVSVLLYHKLRCWLLIRHSVWAIGCFGRPSEAAPAPGVGGLCWIRNGHRNGVNIDVPIASVSSAVQAACSCACPPA